MEAVRDLFIGANIVPIAHHFSFRQMEILLSTLACFTVATVMYSITEGYMLWHTRTILFFGLAHYAYHFLRSLLTVYAAEQLRASEESLGPARFQAFTLQFNKHL